MNKTNKTSARCVPENNKAVCVKTVNSVKVTDGAMMRAPISTPGALSPTYPTWAEPLRPRNELDRDYQAVLHSGEVRGYSAELARWPRSTESAVFIGYINALMAEAKSHGNASSQLTLGDLRAALPFFTGGQILEQLDLWQRAEDGLIFAYQDQTEAKGEERIIKIRYRDAQTRLPEMTIDRVVRVADVLKHGASKAAILFFMATHARRVQNEWIDLIVWGASASDLPPDLRALVKSGAVKRHTKHRSLVRLAERSRLGLPEVRWFASKRNAADNAGRYECLDQRAR